MPKSIHLLLPFFLCQGRIENLHNSRFNEEWRSKPNWEQILVVMNKNKTVTNKKAMRMENKNRNFQQNKRLHDKSKNRTALKTNKKTDPTNKNKQTKNKTEMK